MNLGLDRTHELLERLGNPQDALRFVHVAGTNGKGSTCAFMASVLLQAGYRVGLFTSPALYCFEDRIRVNGENISFEALCEVTEQVKVAAEAMADHPTEFELLTAVAFTYFAQQHCDIVIAEVGLGGRLDSTNVIDTVEVSVITPISFDHCALLGETLAQIAREKAGIIKPSVPVVSAPQGPEVLMALEAAAQERGTTLEVVDRLQIAHAANELSYRTHTGLALGLAGPFQAENAATALEAFDILRTRGWNITEDAVHAGLACATWPGRFDRISEEPLIILDGGHNVAGMEALGAALAETYPQHHRIVLTGVLEDKDYRGMAARLVTFADDIITITPPNPRALLAESYADMLRTSARQANRAIPIAAAPSIEAGAQVALERAQQFTDDSPHIKPLICVCGSLYLLASVMEVLRPTVTSL